MYRLSLSFLRPINATHNWINCLKVYCFFVTCCNSLANCPFFPKQPIPKRCVVWVVVVVVVVFLCNSNKQITMAMELFSEEIHRHNLNENWLEHFDYMRCDAMRWSLFYRHTWDFTLHCWVYQCVPIENGCSLLLLQKCRTKVRRPTFKLIVSIRTN